MHENEIAYVIRAGIFAVYNALGAGLYESIYEKALTIELRKRGLKVETQVAINAVYEGINLGEAYRMDLLVEDKVIIEIKSVETLLSVHHKQLLTYLRLSKLKLGLLVNFNSSVIKEQIIRKVNNL